MKTSSRLARGACLVLLILNLGAIESAHASHSNRLFAVQSRLSTPSFQLILNLRSDGSVATSGSLFGPAGGVYAADFRGETLYGAELENGGANEFLVTIPHEGALVGQGVRVSTTPIGFPSVEGLAVADGTIYATSLNFGGHVTRLITINPTTGVGTLVGTMATDIMLVGLAYDPVNGVMYGAGIPFGGPAGVLQANLYRVNRVTAEATLIGPLGAKVESLSWDVTLGLIGSFAKLYQVNPQTGAATQVGTNDFTAGKPGTFNGIYALAAYVPTNAIQPFVRSIAATGSDVILTWDSIPSVAYRVESRTNLTAGIWSELTGNIIATGAATTHTNVGGATAPEKFFRVKSVPLP